jgi:hypothetical protein
MFSWSQHSVKGAPSQVWPEAWIEELPKLLRGYKAAFWDVESETILVIPRGSFNDTIPVITLTPNEPTSARVGLLVASLGSKSMSNMRDVKSYRLILGQL